VQLPISPTGIGRFRVNAFVQQGHVGLVMRTIPQVIPTIDSLGLPHVLKDVAMTKRGLTIFVGATGSGKSTSLAAMVDFRNENSYGHIITVEDRWSFVPCPQELHRHPTRGRHRYRRLGAGAEELPASGTRRDPDGRDPRPRDDGARGGLRRNGPPVPGTLHANSSNQALDRIINFFPEERRAQLLMDLSLNLKALVSQRLLPRQEGKGRIAAVEVLLNTPLVADMIFKARSRDQGTDEALARAGHADLRQALFDLYEANMVTYEDALRNATR